MAKKKDKDTDITDLTDEAEEVGSGAALAGKQKKGGKKVKEPKELQPRGSNPSGDGAPKGLFGKLFRKKDAGAGAKNPKRRRLIIKLLIIFIPIILVAAFIVEEFVLFNWLGTKDIVDDFLVTVITKLDPKYEDINEQIQTKGDEREASLDGREREMDRREANMDRREAGLNDRDNRLNDRKLELDTREGELKENEKELDLRNERLDARSEQLDKREEQINLSQSRSVPAYLREMTEEELADIMSVSTSYSRMDPGTAAGILVELRDPNDVATILYYMSERNAAAILSVMEPEFAARITEILMNS